jgi:site-specific DNA recombinase
MKTLETSKSTENQTVTFYRVSTASQDNDRQYSDVRKYCQAYGYTIVKEFEETISGKSELSERSELKSMLKYVDENKPEFVIVSELSRLGRSNLTLDIIEKLTKMKICFISLKEGLKTLNPDKSINPTTQLIIDILNGINKFELETIRYRVKSGLNKTVNNGTWSGGNAPFGYDIVDKKLVINSESESVRFMFEKSALGWGTHRIASQLNTDNITSKEGKSWSDVKVRKILYNPIYVGKRLWNNETIEQSELRIVEDSTYTSVQNRLTNNLNVSPINKQKKYDYLLQGKMVCACGKNYVGEGRHNVYKCKSQKYAGGCDIKTIKINWIDEEIKKQLFINYDKILFDYNSIADKTAELKSEVQYLQKEINDEKKTQNYLINNIAKIGQRNFDKKFDSSVELVNKLQKEIDELNIKINKRNSFYSESMAVFNKKKMKGDFKNMNVEDVIIKVNVDKDLVQKAIERIDIDNEKISVSLISGDTFNILRK